MPSRHDFGARVAAKLAKVTNTVLSGQVEITTSKAGAIESNGSTRDFQQIQDEIESMGVKISYDEGD